MSEVHHDTFENVFAHGIQNYKQPESIADTYVVNENDSNIISYIPNMDPHRSKEEHDYVDYEKQRALFASLIKNLKCHVEKCNKVNGEAQQVNALLTNELERYKEKGKHLAKDKTIKSDYCKKIKLSNDEISNLKSQACQNDKTFAWENGKYDEMKDDLKYVTFLKDEFDEKCLISDIQQEFFKTQFKSAILESHSHVYQNEMFEENSSLEKMLSQKDHN
nr:ribonuclease H-like domain-containing protein [Tanacetum cinerariifolium]